jgi:hypothetical protein
LVHPLVVNKKSGLTARGRSGCLRRRGFSLLDVLVTMAVITVLISLLMPTLSGVRETAHQVVCRSNVRQVGLGIAMYAEANDDLIPKTVLVTPPQNLPWETNSLRYRISSNVTDWDGLGLLYSEDYLPAPRLFYCPSHRGRNPYVEYQDRWGRGDGEIVGNYQYRGSGPRRGAPISAPGVMKLSQIEPNAAIVADALRTQDEFNHSVGANVLRAGLTVTWFSDRQGVLSEMLPKDGEVPQIAQFLQIWRNLDGY